VYIRRSTPNYATPFPADFDGDGLADLILSWSVAGPPFIQQFEFRRNLGTNPITFGSGVPIALPPEWAPGKQTQFGVKIPFRFVDFDGDGRQELPLCPADPTVQPDYALLMSTTPPATSRSCCPARTPRSTCRSSST